MTKLEPADLKKALRHKIAETRSAIPEQLRKNWSAAVCEHTYQLCSSFMREGRPLTILSFVSFQDEVDTWPLNEKFLQSGYVIAVPRVNKALKQLDLHVITSVSDLTPGTWGIMEPKEGTALLSDLACIDAIVVPGLAFDRSGGRLGYGGGFYDRLFRRFETEGISIPKRIAAGFGIQIVDEVPMDEHDYRVDYIVTEAGIHETVRKSS